MAFSLAVTELGGGKRATVQVKSNYHCHVLRAESTATPLSVYRSQYGSRIHAKSNFGLRQELRHYAYADPIPIAIGESDSISCSRTGARRTRNRAG